jgi:hypothetical protein
LSGEASAEVNEVVDIVREGEKKGKPERDAVLLVVVEPRLAVGQGAMATKEGMSDIRRRTPMARWEEWDNVFLVLIALSVEAGTQRYILYVDCDR